MEYQINPLPPPPVHHPATKPATQQANKPKNKFSVKNAIIVSGVLLLIITLPIAGMLGKRTTDNRSKAYTNAQGISCNGSNCTLTQAPSCANMAGTSYYCPGGLTNNRCLQNAQSIGTFSPGQTVNLTNYTRGNCSGVMQFDWDIPSQTTGTGGCGAVTIDLPMPGQSCGSTNTTTTNSSSGCQSTWCTAQSQCQSVGGTWSSGSGYCSNSSDVRCCPATTSGGTTTNSTQNTTAAATQQSECGGSCSSTADCKWSPMGFQPICSGGICTSPTCPTDYENSLNCACKTPTGKCGDRCGYWSDGFQPLCGDGISSCSWVVSAPVCGARPNATYCIPDIPKNGYTHAVCSSEPSYMYLIAPTGSVVTTQAQVRESCYDAAPAPTPTPPPMQLAAACINITSSSATYPVGSQVHFTCGSVNGASSYQFRYRIDTGTAQDLAVTATGSNQSIPLTISSTGRYQVQCQACTSTGCSGYESW